ncbi:MAG TPA: TolC family protein, partial [Tepidisphaeraceae bacterium]|nr:TolC family protein [Tepidisphaeraceae bacterium]
QGLRTSTDVLDAQTRLADARSSEIGALADYQIAQVDLAYATGTLLGAAAIEWSPRSDRNP